MTPIFEHGGKSERSWQTRLRFDSDNVLRESIKRTVCELYLCLGEGVDGFVTTYAETLFATARELERRQMERGKGRYE
jgi:hypothetical protein